MPEWPEHLGPSRILSLLISIAYLLIGLFLEQPKSARDVIEILLITMAIVVFPLACIWFGDELGDYYGALPGPAITSRTPGWMVKTGGWFLLLLPVIVGWFFYLE